MKNDNFTAHIEKFESMPTIQSQMPMPLNEGGKLSNVGYSCPQCLAAIKPEHLKGIVTPLEQVTKMEGIALCLDCRVLIPVDYRFREDAWGVKAEYFDKEGKWKSEYIIKSWAGRFLGWFGLLQ